MGASSSPCDALGDRAGDEDIHARFRRAPFPASSATTLGLSTAGDGVRHADDGGEAARRRRARAGGDCFLRALPRLAQVHVDIDQPGAMTSPVQSISCAILGAAAAARRRRSGRRR